MRHCSFLKPPQIVLTLGDPAGIGPEIVAAAIAHFEKNPQELRGCVLKVIGNQHPHHPGHPTKESALTALASLEEAARMALQGELTAVVTGPVNKHQLHQVGFPFPGQTEFFAARANVSNYAMLLTGGKMAVALVTAHLPLCKVASTLRSDEIVRVGSLLIDFLKRRKTNLLSKLTSVDEVPDSFGSRNHDALEDANTGATPQFRAETEFRKKLKIAVLGLNPHAGEQGEFGNEEETIITPAIQSLIKLHPEVQVVGPTSPDTTFWHAAEGAYDGLLCMYHDQGLIPLKLHAFYEGVNVTLGLPFLRVSPDHGTAYALAGKGIARADSTIAAVRLAVELSAP